MLNYSPEIIWNFKLKILIKNPDDCWLWCDRVDVGGYGIFSLYGKETRAHRFAKELDLNRKILPGLLVLHSCDNPPCCNPKHLYEGTQFDNMQEMAAKKRCNNCGENNPNAILTLAQVIEIRFIQLFYTKKELARKYNVSEEAIYHAMKPNTWKTKNELLL